MFQSITTSIKLAFRNLRSNVGRTILSLTGVVIGIAAVIIVLSLGAGIKQFVIDQVESFGTDIIEVEVKVPKVSKTSSQNAGGLVGGTQITTFKIEDAEAIAKIGNIGAWYGAIMSQQILSYKNINKQTIIMGVTAGVAEADEQAKIESGEMFSEEDNRSIKQVVVLGSDVKDKFFGEENAIGKSIKIKGQRYKVIGTLKKRGLTGFFNFDNTIYMPLETLQKKIMGIDYIQFAVFKMNDTNKLDSTVAQANDIMRDQHDITKPDDEDFAVNSIVEVKDILGKVFFTLNALLLSLASISLLVGGVGIMNTMYVAVTERTFEIGLRKSIGAKNNDILKQFLFEAIFITFLGGIIGIIIGFGVSYLAEYIFLKLGFFAEFKVTLTSIIISFGFSAIIGIIFGYYPARKASMLSPMEALRKE